MRDFNHTVNVLVKAYLNGTLEPANCYACAVGNLVANAHGYEYVKRDFGLVWKGGVDPVWFDSVMCGLVRENQTRKKISESREQVEKTGYSLEEIAMIEVAFENPSIPEYGNYIGSDRQFNGLMAVVEVLADIHGISLEQKSEAKAMFVKETL